MRSARSSVEDAAGRSPCAACAFACVTSARVAGERVLSCAGGAGGRGVSGASAGGGCGGGIDSCDGSVGGCCGGTVGRNSEQPAVSAAAASRTAHVLKEACA